MIQIAFLTEQGFRVMYEHILRIQLSIVQIQTTEKQLREYKCNSRAPERVKTDVVLKIMYNFIFKSHFTSKI